MNITYRELFPSENKKYREIRFECLKNAAENFGSTYEEQSVLPELFFETAIKNSDANAKIFGAFNSEELIAICGYTREKGIKVRHKVLLVQVFTKPEYRGKNVSFNLLKFMIEKIFADETIDVITLGVVSENTSAIKLYERLGFEEYGCQKKYFKDGERYYDQKLMMLER
ncbi:MAG: GNAT family N-acetyltransferase [Bacteroidetes bacterium]|nr:GNAT family N-acetyltransferase [Bacteroidota bacterium]